jgi:uncharacterized protein
MADCRRLIIPVAHTLVLLALFLAMAAPVGAVEPPVHECDQLAAHKHDRQRVADGVRLEDIDATSAIEACSAALEEFPGTLRFEFQLGRALMAGRRDEDAVVHYRAAAEQGFAPAQAALGQVYFDGAGVTRNQQTAFNWFWESAVQGNSAGQHWTGHIYRLRRQFDQALQWIRKAAEQGVASAQISMVGIYRYEMGGMAGSDLEAAKWAERAARQGDVIGFEMLAYFYAQGLGVPKNMETAQHYFGMALAKHEIKAANGDPEAQVALGNLYGGWAAGLGDDGEAMKWYHKAAEQDYAEAQYIIGRGFLHGFRGAVKDLDEAVLWLRQAAKQGHLEAASELGQLYNDESAGMLNKDEAMKWYLHAASRGHVISQASLGSLFMSMYTKSNNRRAKDTYLNSTLYWWKRQLSRVMAMSSIIS